jgi:putative oligomerization/nucleic acid binding protein/phospholipase D-like protein
VDETGRPFSTGHPHRVIPAPRAGLTVESIRSHTPPGCRGAGRRPEAIVSNYPLLDAFLTMLWFFLWVMWFMLLFRVVYDVFSDDSLSGWGKAGWTVFVCVLPFLGVFVYLAARGRSMGERALRRAQVQEQAFRSYVQEAASGPAPGPSKADELAKLAGLHDHGDITDAEYETAKAKVLVR